MCWRRWAMRRPRRPTAPTWSSSTPATSARRRRRRCSPSLAACAQLSGARRARAARWSSPSPAASPRPRARRSCARAPYVDIVLGPQTYHRLPEMVARASRAAGAVIETDFPAEDKFDHLPEAARAAGRHRLPDGAGGLRQVLQLLRGALHPRRRILAAPPRRSWPRRGAWWRAGAREITLLGQNVNAYHGEGPDGGDLGPRPAAARAGGDPRPAAAALHHLPPARHGRRPDRRPWRRAGTDALPASAGAERLRPDPGGDEPRPHRRRLPPHRSTGCARRGRTSRSPPTSSSAIPARPTPISRRRWRWSREVGFAQAYSASNTRPAPARRPPARRTGAGGGEGSHGCRRSRRCSATSRTRSTARASG